jgi:hypothetical protein
MQEKEQRQQQKKLCRLNNHLPLVGRSKEQSDPDEDASSCERRPHPKFEGEFRPPHKGEAIGAR